MTGAAMRHTAASGAGARSLALLGLAIAAGAALRLDQLRGQILIDDEWHAVHRLLAGGPADIFRSLGYADHSVPLTLLYWLEARWFGLSELAMRWPMLLAGLATLALLPLYVRRRFGPPTAVLFAWLLALSPMLVNYSRTARPYAITLLLACLAYWAFYRYLDKTGAAASGVLAGVCMVLAMWLHPIIALFLLPPFLMRGVAALRAPAGERGRRLWRLSALAVPVAAAVLLLLLPPLLSDPGAVGNKLGSHSPGSDSVVGAWHLWTGARTPAVAGLFLVLAVVGLPRVWRELEAARAATLGLALTLAAILLTRPDWIQLPVVLARYLLPAVPLLLLLVAVGSVAVVAALSRRRPGAGRLAVLLLAVPALAQAAQSPLREQLRRPNNETLHSYFQFDFRPAENLMRGWVEEIPVSAYWETLRAQPRGSMRVAVAPWQFESYHWAGPRWERASRQHVVPGLLVGLCVERRLGEYRQDSGVALANMVRLADPDDLRAKGIRLVAFQKPFGHTIAGIRSVVGAGLESCQGALQARFGEPVYEDDRLAVFDPANSLMEGGRP